MKRLRAWWRKFRERLALFFRGDADLRRVLAGTTKHVVLYRGALDRVLYLATVRELYVEKLEGGLARPMVLIDAHQFVDMLEGVYGAEHPYVASFLDRIMGASVEAIPAEVAKEERPS